MNTETATLLVKSARAIHSAELLLAGGEPDFAAGRAYYAMFYAAQALLHLKGLRSRKHSGVHQLFWEHFVKTALIDPKFHRWLLDAFDQRLHADYAFEVAITSEDAAETIDQARQFLKEAQNFLAAP